MDVLSVLSRRRMRAYARVSGHRSAVTAFQPSRDFVLFAFLLFPARYAAPAKFREK